jgi:hypothetical protein
MTKKPTALRTMEHSVTRYHHTPEIDTAIEDVLDPAYWTHVAKTMRPGDEIVVTAADMSWRAELLVREADRLSASVMLISDRQFDSTDMQPLTAIDTTDALSPVWRGPTHKWAAVRPSDGEVVKQGFASKGDAIQWIGNHVKARAA